MPLLIRAAVVLAVLAGGTPAQGAEEYGQATVRKGRMTVLRGGARTVHAQAGAPVPILRQDVIRVGRDSMVVLETVQKATLTLGSNAVFHVKPWEREGRRGLLRMLYGRFRAAISGLTGSERFNVRTATATIGVKGTGYTGAAPPQGDALVWVHDHVVQLSGHDGQEQDIAQGFVSVVINGGNAKRPVRVPAGLLQVLATRGLDAPAPNSPAALALPGEAALITAGLITGEEAGASRRSGAGVDPRSGELIPGSEAAAQSAQAAEEVAAAILAEQGLPEVVEDALETVEQNVQDTVDQSPGPESPLGIHFER